MDLSRSERHSNNFRFKSNKRSRSPALSSNPQRSKRHKSHSYRRDRTTQRKASPDPATPPLSPDTAFRESLFDALADEEGADYWASVYGQPIHTYSRYHMPEQDGDQPSVDENGNPILERMEDDEYAAYVRRRMWEKSRDFVEEMRQRRAQDKEGERAAGARARHRRREREEMRAFWESLENRKSTTSSHDHSRDATLKERWHSYQRAWEELAAFRDTETAKQQPTEAAVHRKQLAAMIPWPTKSGKARDITRDSVEKFFRNAGDAITPSEGEKVDQSCMLSLLKIERVRWHPDKALHRFGSLGIDESILQDVTAVFQIIDALWTTTKENA